MSRCCGFVVGLQFVVQHVVYNESTTNRSKWCLAVNALLADEVAVTRSTAATVAAEPIVTTRLCD